MTWTCPECGARFVTRNLSHSCVKRAAEEFFAASPPGGVAHARALIAELERFGPVTLHAVKTRIALMVDVRFAAINRIGRDAIRAHLWLRKRYASKRFAKIEKLGERDWLYHFVVSDTQPIDAELRRFLRRAYANGRRAAPKRHKKSSR
jgi:uncharacterized protein DUF5655